MNKALNRLSEIYKNRSLEVQKKARRLLAVNVIGFGIIGLILLGHIVVAFSLLAISGQLICLAAIGVSIILLFSSKIDWAGYLSLTGIIGMIYFEYVIHDYYAVEISFLRVYESLALILTGFALLGLFATNKKQIIYYSFFSLTGLLFHTGLVIEKAITPLDDKDVFVTIANAYVYFVAGISICYFVIVKNHDLLKTMEFSRNKAHLKYKLLFNNMLTAYVNIHVIRSKDGSIKDAIIKETNVSFNNFCNCEGGDIRQKHFSQLPANILEFFGDLSSLVSAYRKDNNVILNRVMPETDKEYRLQFYSLRTDSIVILITSAS